MTVRIALMLLFATLLACNTNKKKTVAQTQPPALTLNVLERTKEKPGFIPANTMTRLAADTEAFFPASEYLCDLSMLDFPADKPPHRQKNVQIISPDKFTSWQDAGINDPNIRYFLITPGDYTAWDKLESTASGTATQKRIIRYYDPTAADPYHPPHPVILADQKGKEVIVESIRLIGASHWVFHGLTIRGRGNAKKGLVGGHTSQIGFGADHNIVNFCLFEEFLGVGAMRIFQANYNCIQNCVIRNPAEGLGVDMGGVGVSAYHNEIARGNRIVNNEMINLTDGVGLIRNVNREGILEKSQMGEVPGTIIENNDIYLDPSRYTYKNGEEWGCAENGLDFKEGTTSTDPKDRILVLNNRIWGFRFTDQTCGGSGSVGAGIVVHRNAKNYIIKGNIIFDVPQGISISGPNKKKYPDELAENIALLNNLFFDIKNTHPDNFNSGLALRLTANVDVYYNTIKSARQLVYLKGNKAINRFQCNTFIDIEESTPYEENRKSFSSLNAWYGYPDEREIYASQGGTNVYGKEAADAQLDDFTFYVKRWTGPQPITVENVVPTANRPGPSIINKDEDCHCGPGGEGGRWWTRQ